MKILNRILLPGTGRQGPEDVRSLPFPSGRGRLRNSKAPLWIKRLAAVPFSLALVLGGASIWAAPAAHAADGGMVSVTFDDGWASQYNNALPVLNKYGIPATMYIISGSVNAVPSYMTQDQIQAFASRGDEIAAHTVTHPDLTTLTPDQVDNELA
ncbi:MAG: hypothetical protein NVSMB43_20770 [Pseudarthrobacter sp.]